MNSPITDRYHIISDKKYYSCPIYFNFLMYILILTFLHWTGPGKKFYNILNFKNLIRQSEYTDVSDGYKCVCVCGFRFKFLLLNYKDEG